MNAHDEFSQIFWTGVKQGERGLEKIAASGTLFIQRKLRENAFSRLIVPPTPVTAAQCIPSDVDESLYFLEEIEPDSIATRLTWRSEPEKIWYRGKKMRITFQLIGSKEFQKSEQELMSWRMPITRIIEQNTVKDVQELEDKIFMDKVHGGLFLATKARFNTLVADGVITGATATYNFNTDNEFVSYLFTKNKRAGVWSALAASAIDRADADYTNIVLSDEARFNRNVMAEGIKVTLGRELRPKVLLMHEATYADTVAWTLNDAGLEVTSEIVKEGYKYRKVAGYDIITTIRLRPDIVPNRVIYFFPDAQFFGRFLVLEPLKFSIEKHHRFLSMQCWEQIGMGFANVHGLGAVVLDGGRIPLQVILQTPTGGFTTAGTLVVINNYGLAAIPSVVP